jgi:hypothetical protein
MNLHAIDLKKLNSMTKYPSIPTYHALGERGVLLDSRIEFSGSVIVREKIDGTNARIIFTGGGYLIGSREELLYAQGDLIGNPALGIVDAVKPIAEKIGEYTRTDSAINVIYGEVYGGNVTAASKQYTGEKRIGFRMFDAITIDKHADLFAWAPEQIASWRDGGGQHFLSEEKLQTLGAREHIPLAPLIFNGEIDGGALPKAVEDVLPWLNRMLPHGSLAALDDGAVKRPEGVVVRTPDRKTIAKLRFEDYERHAKRRK